MPSRSLADLTPDTRERVSRWLELCAARGVDVLVYCTYRTAEEQEDIYAQGRTRSGPKLTNARAWQSWHNVRRAVDAVPMRGGKPLWGYGALIHEWIVFAEEAERVGLEWAGRWVTFREYVHVQYTGGMSLDEARASLEDAT